MREDLRDLYQEVILDHGRNPRNHRHPADATHEAHGDNPMCGDRVVVYLKLTPDGRIEDAAFEGRGCAISQASASLMTEMVHGRTVAEARTLFDHFHHICTSDEPADPAGIGAEDAERLEVMAGVRQFPMRVKCATLAWHTMNTALAGDGRTSTE